MVGGVDEKDVGHTLRRHHALTAGAHRHTTAHDYDSKCMGQTDRWAGRQSCVMETIFCQLNGILHRISFLICKGGQGSSGRCGAVAAVTV